MHLRSWYKQDPGCPGADATHHSTTEALRATQVEGLSKAREGLRFQNSPLFEPPLCTSSYFISSASQRPPTDLEVTNSRCEYTLHFKELTKLNSPSDFLYFGTSVSTEYRKVVTTQK